MVCCGSLYMPAVCWVDSGTTCDCIGRGCQCLQLWGVGRGRARQRERCLIMCESTLNIHWKDWRWSWSYNTLASWYEELTHWKRPWCWERFKAGEGDNRGLDGWIASPTQWTWVWVSSGSCWWTGKPGVLQSMGSQRVEHNGATGLNMH